MRVIHPKGRALIRQIADGKRVTVPYDWAIMDKADGHPPYEAQAVAGQDSGYLLFVRGQDRCKLQKLVEYRRPVPDHALYGSGAQCHFARL